MPPRAQPRPFAAAIASLLGNPRHSPLLGKGTIWQVAKHDLFGTKDVQDSPTLSYVWLADQFGHFGIGFAGTLAVGGVIAAAFGWSPSWCAFAVGVLLAAWFAYKEWRDYRDEQSHQNARIHADLLSDSPTPPTVIRPRPAQAPLRLSARPACQARLLVSTIVPA